MNHTQAQNVHADEVVQTNVNNVINPQTTVQLENGKTVRAGQVVGGTSVHVPAGDVLQDAIVIQQNQKKKQPNIKKQQGKQQGKHFKVSDLSPGCLVLVEASELKEGSAPVIVQARFVNDSAKFVVKNDRSVSQLIADNNEMVETFAKHVDGTTCVVVEPIPIHQQKNIQSLDGSVLVLALAREVQPNHAVEVEARYITDRSTKIITQSKNGKDVIKTLEASKLPDNAQVRTLSQHVNESAPVVARKENLINHKNVQQNGVTRAAQKQLDNAHGSTNFLDLLGNN